MAVMAVEHRRRPSTVNGTSRADTPRALTSSYAWRQEITAANAAMAGTAATLRIRSVSVAAPLRARPRPGQCSRVCTAGSLRAVKGRDRAHEAAGNLD
jgi:hypothetical protein